MTFANFDITALGNNPSQPANQRDEAAVRKMAADFEALLLRQLTSSINPSSDDEDGESLFGQGGGLSLSRQLFSEQMADTMAKNGGVGLADMIVKQVLDKRTGKESARLNTEASRALDAARSIRTKSSPKTVPDKGLSMAEESAPARAIKSMAGKGQRVADGDRYPDAIIISRASDSNRTLAPSRAAASKTPSPVSAPSDNLSEISPIDSSDSAADSSPLNSLPENTPVTPYRPERFLTEDDVLSVVRPRRVHDLPKVENSFDLPTVEKSLPRVQSSPRVSSLPGVNSWPRRSGVARAHASSPRIASPRVSSAAPASPVLAETRVSATPVSLQMFVRGPIRSRFGPRIDPIDKVPRFHRGIDIAAPTGTPIGAAAEGRVVFSGPDKGHGNMVVVEHADGTLTRYAHASQLLVKEGDYVESGQTLALVGSTGHSTGPHLHFEVIKDGIFIDPLKVLPKAFTLARR